MRTDVLALCPASLGEPRRQRNASETLRAIHSVDGVLRLDMHQLLTLIISAHVGCAAATLGAAFLPDDLAADAFLGVAADIAESDEEGLRKIED